jgi:hypothetical protein
MLLITNHSYELVRGRRLNIQITISLEKLFRGRRILLLAHTVYRGATEIPGYRCRIDRQNRVDRLACYGFIGISLFAAIGNPTSIEIERRAWTQNAAVAAPVRQPVTSIT